jgi:hypothetical protein
MNSILKIIRSNTRLPHSLLVTCVRRRDFLLETTEIAQRHCRTYRTFKYSNLVYSKAKGTPVQRLLSSQTRRTTFRIPDELWVLLIVGKCGDGGYINYVRSSFFF